MLKTLYLLLKSARPTQWVKNFSLYAALVFSGFFFNSFATGMPYFLVVTAASGLFCLLTSSIYILNDIADKEADCLHPFKKLRPIASGELSSSLAGFVAFCLIGTVIVLSLQLSMFFSLCVVAYIFLQFLYVHVTKHIAILDVLSIATGFLLRVYAGAVVVDLHMDVWFLLTVISASLFLAVGKRQSERTLLQGREVGETRKTLRRYSQRLLDQYTGMFANSTWLTYALFAFQKDSVQPTGILLQVFTFVPPTLRSQKLLMLSVPFVIFGVMRYLQLVYESNQGESPEKVLLSDKPLIFAAIIFAVIVMFVTYLL